MSENNNKVADSPEEIVVATDVVISDASEINLTEVPLEQVSSSDNKTSNEVLLQQIKDMQAQQAQLVETLSSLSNDKSTSTELDVDKLMSEIKKSVSESNQATTKNLLKKIQSLEAHIEKSKVEDAHFEKIAQEQVRKAQVQAYKKQVTANLAFPELVTGSTVEEINNSLKQQVEREAKLTSKGAKENLEEILKSNPSLARTINPSANIESSSTLLDGSYKDKRNMMLDTLKDKRKFQSELDKLKRSVLDNGFGPNFRR